MPEEEKRPPQEPETPPDKPEAKAPLKETLYDKIPLTYRQVDILVKVMIGVIVVLLVVGTIMGNRG